MSNVLINREKIDILANAIIDKSGAPVISMTLDEMLEAVDGIENNPAPILQAKTYTVDSAGTAAVTADSGYDGLSSVLINVPSGVFGDVSWSSSTTSIQRKYTYQLPIKTAGFFEAISITGTLSLGLETSTITPTENSQTITPSATNKYLNLVTVNAIPSNYVGSGITQRSSSDLTASGATVTVPSGYYSSNASKSVANGSATPASSISATGATVSTGTNTLTLSKSVSNTPQVSAGYISSGTSGNSTVSLTANVTTLGANTYTPHPTSTQTIVANQYLTGAQTINPIPSQYIIPSGTYNVTSSGTKDVTSYASASVPAMTLPTAPGQSSSGTKKGTITTSLNTRYLNINAGFNDSAQYYEVAPMVLDDKTITENGTYLAYMENLDGYSSVTVNVSGGGGGNAQLDEADATSTTASISFTGLLGEPTSFYICYVGQSYITIPTGTPYKTVDVVYDGTNTFGNIATSTNNAQASYSTNFSYTYSNGTLTVTGTASNFIGAYHIIYTYGGSTADIHTKEVQVGSGATSITFTGLEAEPAYWSCAFKSNFGTNTQNYQRVMSIGYGYGGNLIIGYAVGADIGVGGWWTWTYNNGSLTITSQGTNSGGYFHQPGNYQLTYAYNSGGGGSGTYQTKTINPSTSQQIITADTGYDALSSVTVTGVSQTNLSAANIKSGTTITINNGQNNLWSVTGTYTGSSGTVNIDTKTLTNSTATATSLQFTSMKGTPKAFFLRLTAQIARNSSYRYYYVENVRYNGTNTNGRYFYQYSGQLTNDTTHYSYSYSGTTLTISSTGSQSGAGGSFYNGAYELVYIY